MPPPRRFPAGRPQQNMDGELVALLVTFCIASTMVSCSHGLLPSLLESTLETIPEDHLVNDATLSDDLVLTTSDASWTTVPTDMPFSTESTVPNWATTTEGVTFDESSATTATETQLCTDVTTAELTTSDTFWVTASTDITHSTRNLDETASVTDALESTWSTWSTCSSPCDGGVQSRFRVMEITTNAGILEESKIDTSSSRLCNTNFCQVEVTEESYGVYIDLRTTLSTEQYIQVRDQIRAGVGWEIIRFCNSSNNFATCCAGQTLRAPLAHSQAVPDAIVVKRAASPQNDSTLMRLFLVVKADAAIAICEGPEGSATIATRGVARRSAQNEQLYMAPTVLSRLLESGSLAQTITGTIENHFPNATVVIVASRLGASVASLPSANNVTSSTVKSCGALMELSQNDQQCIYSIAFYVAIASPSVALLMVVVVILSAYKLRRRRLQWTSRCGGGSSRGSRGRTQSISMEQTDSDPQRRNLHLAHSSRGFDAAHSIVKQDSLTQICESNDNLNDTYENVTTFRGGSQAREPAVAAAATNDALQPRPLPPSPQPACRAEDADAYELQFEQPTNSDDLQQTIALPLAWQQLATESAAVASSAPAVREHSELLTQDEYVYAEARAADWRPAAATPAATLPERGEYNYAVRMSEIDSEYANVEEEFKTVRHSALADGNMYVAMG